MNRAVWRMLATWIAYVGVAAALSLAAAAVTDTREVGAFTLGALLLGGWLGSTMRRGLSFTNPHGQSGRLDALYVTGVSVLIIAFTLGLTDLGAASWAVFAIGAVLAYLGWRRSDLPTAPRE